MASGNRPTPLLKTMALIALAFVAIAVFLALKG
jgi:hypothetical protein